MKLFEVLRALSLSKNYYAETIMSWDVDDLNTFLNIINSAINQSQQDSEGAYRFVANTQLSGGSIPCHSLECRFKHLDFLVRNTLLYADKVYIQNYFNYHGEFSYISDSIKEDIINSICLLYYIKPLLEKGIVEICASTHHFCASCYQHIIVNKVKVFEDKLENAQKYLFNRYLREGKFVLQEEEGVPTIYIDGPADLFEHPTVVTFGEAPENIMAIVDSTRRIKLKQKDVKKSGLAAGFVYQVMEDLQMQNYYANTTSSKYLTGRELDFQVLERLQSDEKSVEGKMIFNNLSHSVPFIFDATLNSLLKLRKNEGEAFKVYRDSLNKLLSELNEKEPEKIKQALADVIQPELNKIDQTIKNSKKLIWSDMTKDVLVGGSFIGISLFGGILPANIGQIVSALGGIRYADKFGDNIANLIRDSKEMKNNNFYFLWKVKEKSRVIK